MISERTSWVFLVRLGNCIGFYTYEKQCFEASLYIFSINLHATYNKTRLVSGSRSSDPGQNQMKKCIFSFIFLILQNFQIAVLVQMNHLNTLFRPNVLIKFACKVGGQPSTVMQSLFSWPIYRCSIHACTIFYYLHMNKCKRFQYSCMTPGLCSTY